MKNAIYQFFNSVCSNYFAATIDLVSTFILIGLYIFEMNHKHHAFIYHQTTWNKNWLMRLWILFIIANCNSFIFHDLMGLGGIKIHRKIWLLLTFYYVISGNTFSLFSLRPCGDQRWLHGRLLVKWPGKFFTSNRQQQKKKKFDKSSFDTTQNLHKDVSDAIMELTSKI